MDIRENYQKIRAEIPSEVRIVVAAKGRTSAEIEEVIEAGATDIGENYVQEAEIVIKELDSDLVKRVNWHMIGPLQKNKINKALPIFDFIQSVDSLELAKDIDKRVLKSGKKSIPVLLEINIGSEESKHGIKPDEHERLEKFMEQLVYDVSNLAHIRLVGLMTMGAFGANPEQFRQDFRRTKNIFDHLAKLGLEQVDMEYLSMGMTDSYHIAIEEGANVVRIGTAIFGPRKYCLR